MPSKRCEQAGTAAKPKRARIACSEPSRLGYNEHDDCIHVHTRPSQTPKTSPFLSLPRELRDQIYHEIWRLTPPIEVSLPAKGDHKSLAEASGSYADHYIFRIVYEMTQKPARESKPAPKRRRKSAALVVTTQPPRPWFLASRQVLYEAMEEFNSQVTWTYMGRLCNQNLAPAAWKAPLTKRRTVRLGPLLLGLSNAANIQMPTRFSMYVYGTMNSKESPVSVVQFESSSVELLRAFTAGIAGTTRLKRLSLGVQAHAWLGGASDHSIKVDLRLLESLELPNLQLLQLDVSFNPEFRSDQRLMADLQEGLSVLGKKLFGGVVREQFHEKDVSQALVDIEWCFTWTRCRT